ncbi:MAG: hypothetical protein ABI854_11105 [Betaproteobacteria bacterium]
MNALLWLAYVIPGEQEGLHGWARNRMAGAKRTLPPPEQMSKAGSSRSASASLRCNRLEAVEYLMNDDRPLHFAASMMRFDGVTAIKQLCLIVFEATEGTRFALDKLSVNCERNAQAQYVAVPILAGRH